MTGARAALAVVVVLSGPRTVAAEPCAPRAQLDGGAAVVARVGEELRKLGVSIGAAERGCRTVRAQVELDREGGIAVAIVDGSRRSEGRVVSGAGVAAAWIDSWLRDDLDGVSAPAAPDAPDAPSATVAPATPAAPLPAPLLAPPTAPAAPPPRTASVAAPARGASIAPGLVPPREHRDAPGPGSPPPPLLERLALAAAYEYSWLGDGATATGLGAGACLRVGRACFGVRGGHSREPARPVSSTAMARSDASIFATAGASIAVGRMSISPELGLGIGRRRTQQLACTTAPSPGGNGDADDPGPVDPNPGELNCPDPADPACMAPPPAPLTCVNGASYHAEGLDEATLTPRAAATLRVAVPLFEHVWLEGAASVSFAPFGHELPFRRGSEAGDPPSSGAFELPGEPWAALQLGIGLRVGAR